MAEQSATSATPDTLKTTDAAKVVAEEQEETAPEELEGDESEEEKDDRTDDERLMDQIDAKLVELLPRQTAKAIDTAIVDMVELMVEMKIGSVLEIVTPDECNSLIDATCGWTKMDQDSWKPLYGGRQPISTRGILSRLVRDRYDIRTIIIDSKVIWTATQQRFTID